MCKDPGELSFSESACVRRDAPTPVLLESGTLGIFLLCLCNRLYPVMAMSQQTLFACFLTTLPISDISLLFLPLTVSVLLTQDDKYYILRR